MCDENNSKLLGDQPKVFKGLVAPWPAISLWQDTQHLIKLAGNANVEVMVSKSTSPDTDTNSTAFIGDMEHVTLLKATLHEYFDGTLQIKDDSSSSSSSSSSQLSYYLAQSEIQKYPHPGPLHALMQDIKIPDLITSQQLYQINLWSSLTKMKSSLHYDPHSNILCVVTGRKRVRLVPFDKHNSIGARRIYSESSNHASLDLFNMNNNIDSTENLQDFTIEYSLDPGDALYIPQGYWHQIESENATLAVNFWWASPAPLFSGTNDHVQSTSLYTLHQSIKSLGQARKERILEDITQTALESNLHDFILRFKVPDTVSVSKKRKKEAPFLLVLDNGTGIFTDGNDGNDSMRSMNAVCGAYTRYIISSYLPHQGKDLHQSTWPDFTISLLLCLQKQVGYFACMHVLLSIRNECPDIIQKLLLSNDTNPIFIELITCFDGAKLFAERAFHEYISAHEKSSSVLREMCDELCQKFYSSLYSCVSDDQRGRMFEVMLKKKEEFTRNAMELVVKEELHLFTSS